MKLYKKSERTLNTYAMLKSLRETGYNTRNLGQWCRWKEVECGRLQVKIDVYEVKNDIMTVYLVSDTLNRVAAPLIADKQEVMQWLQDHGYKTDKQFHIEDCGMSEELWNEWNEGM